MTVKVKKNVSEINEYSLEITVNSISNKIIGHFGHEPYEGQTGSSCIFIKPTEGSLTETNLISLLTSSSAVLPPTHCVCWLVDHALSAVQKALNLELNYPMSKKMCNWHQLPVQMGTFSRGGQVPQCDCMHVNVSVWARVCVWAIMEEDGCLAWIDSRKWLVTAFPNWESVGKILNCRHCLHCKSSPLRASSHAGFCF